VFLEHRAVPVDFDNRLKEMEYADEKLLALEHTLRFISHSHNEADKRGD
jgi:hypothetical protein